MEALPPWLVLLGAIIGGGGIAAIGGVVTTYVKDRRTATQGDRSVAIEEVDKAIPGLGDIILQLRTQNKDQAEQIDRLQRRNQELAGDVYVLEKRVVDLERELGHR